MNCVCVCMCVVCGVCVAVGPVVGRNHVEPMWEEGEGMGNWQGEEPRGQVL